MSAKRRQFGRGTSAMAALVGLSRHFGADPEFILAGGGNTSVKTGERLYVKASGYSLADIGREGFVAMDRRALSGIIERELSRRPALREAQFKEAILAARVDTAGGLRPSVECVLHNLVPGKFVVHTHSTWANMIGCSRRGKAVAEELFGDDVLWIPYVDPGYVLAKRLAAGLAAYAKRTGREAPRAILMANHGLIVAGDDAREILRRTARLVERAQRKVGDIVKTGPFGKPSRLKAVVARGLIETIGPALRGLLAQGRALKVVTFDDSDIVMNLVGGAGGRAAAAGGPVAPDQIVYSKAYPMWFEATGGEAVEGLVARLRAAVEKHRRGTGFAPSVVLVKGLGMFAAGDDFAAADTARVVYADAIKVMAGARRLGGVRYLSGREREFIEGWELETYRRRVAAGEQQRGRAAGKVAVVTGAARGFGFEIARSLVEEGAHVALTDINIEGVRRAAAKLGAAARGRVAAFAADVASGESLGEAVGKIIRRYGGFDIVVSNAGVLRAGSVKTQGEKEFEFVTDVNYKGYFNCVQRTSPVLAVQRLAKGDYISDIIQVNSKSGLAGSNRNSAYAGSKFGGIGLTQSFALELIEDGVKVNSVCPGNFLEGPLWSDPKDGLFAQYLRAGKVPGARTIADVRRAYEARVPMGRGCTAADVMKAIYYLIEQEYETGQALPVTGGQVMLS